MPGTVATSRRNSGRHAEFDTDSCPFLSFGSESIDALWWIDWYRGCRFTGKVSADSQATTGETAGQRNADVAQNCRVDGVEHMLTRLLPRDEFGSFKRLQVPRDGRL